MSASDALPAKRARTDDSSSTPVRSTIWHHDGSVVLEASGTQFRVHWSILTTHSSIFKDMYSVPQPDAPGPMVEGCPVVELHDDPKDLEYVLGALYNPMLLGQKSFPFDVQAAFVRLGRKYDFADSRKVGIERLEAENPSTLAGYVAVEARKFKLQHIQYRAGYRVDVVNLLQEQQLISSLPYAYYVLACTRKERWLSGQQRPDGTTALLPSKDLQCCVLGSEKIHNAQYTDGYAFSWLHTSPAAEVCESFTKCTQLRFQILRATTLAEEVFFTFIPERSLQYHAFGFCHPCQRQVSDIIRAGREKAWNNLPTFFGLPGWEHLKDEV